MTDTSSNQVENQRRWSQLVKRAQTDRQLHQQLLNEPMPVLQSEGIEIPEGTYARVAETNGHLQCTFELPMAAAVAAGAELTADELNSVTGGGTKSPSTQTKPGTAKQQTYVTVTLTDVYVSSY